MLLICRTSALKAGKEAVILEEDGIGFFKSVGNGCLFENLLP